jgi:hypothetical protein
MTGKLTSQMLRGAIAYWRQLPPEQRQQLTASAARVARDGGRVALSLRTVRTPAGAMQVLDDVRQLAQNARVGTRALAEAEDQPPTPTAASIPTPDYS